MQDLKFALLAVEQKRLASSNSTCFLVETFGDLGFIDKVISCTTCNFWFNTFNTSEVYNY